MIQYRNDDEILLRFGAWLGCERAAKMAGRLAGEGAREPADFDWQIERSCEAIRRLTAVPATGAVGIALKLFAHAHYVYGRQPERSRHGPHASSG